MSRCGRRTADCRCRRRTHRSCGGQHGTNRPNPATGTPYTAVGRVAVQVVTAARAGLVDAGDARAVGGLAHGVASTVDVGVLQCARAVGHATQPAHGVAQPVGEHEDAVVEAPGAARGRPVLGGGEVPERLTAGDVAGVHEDLVDLTRAVGTGADPEVVRPGPAGAAP